MAITKVPQTSRLQIKVESGTTTSGQTAYKVRSYSNLKPDAADADVYMPSVRPWPLCSSIR
ncbi:DUF1659 domain-containing protein [Propionispora vibrioides]|uniref:DUF1659 domain-containing protein n=1 Tax=Propionispora vibrioides TaxID=112903 RepID=A0A1H8S090_9FIRM|nr:DUF1659 domain-containing protein [Propionispora vibrioides]SEO71603.1 Protein of unknown function [Propionispora vibrioides]